MVFSYDIPTTPSNANQPLFLGIPKKMTLIKGLQ
jgi:hypothetical protein